jgi:hypothetical protein
MRLNTKRGKSILKGIYLICLVILLFDILVLNIEGSWGSITKLSPFAGLLLLFVVYRGLPQFIYDSDGEVLNFTTREPTLSFLGRRFHKHIEFPKRKLRDYRLKRLPFKRKLIIYINSKDSNVVKQSMSISYLSSRELRDLQRSLDKVLVTNRKRKNGRGK